ncbi:MAG: TonB-dependent receptor plug domain-containing protein [Saprospiraceae bacterium]
MKNLFLILFVFSISVTAVAQVDTLELRELEVSATTIRQTPIGSPNQTWSSETLQQLPARNIAELLTNETGVFIKNYGAGSLATSSIRGGSASHTLVLWNGLPVQSPMLGQLDLSLLPSNFVENVSVEYGGNTSMWGSGSIGGTISLNNQVDFTNRFSTASQTSFGSFDYFNQQFKVNVGNDRFQSSTKIGQQQAKNDFEYSIREDLPLRIQTNAEFFQRNILQDFYYKITPKQQFATHFWYQTSNRQIPPTINQNRSVAHQSDEAFRLMMDWKRVSNQTVMKAKAGYFRESLDYFDESILLTSLSQFDTWLGDFEGEFFIKKNQKIGFGATLTHTKALSDGYLDEAPQEFRAAIFANYQLDYKKWSMQLSARQELIDGQFIPFTPSFSINKNLGKNWSIKAKASHNYRLPTLNDKFWQPGGNPDLLPESGWSQEISTVFNYKNDHFKINTSVTGFNRTIQNWIFWSIESGQSFWSPRNITSVWSRGAEGRLDFTYQIKQVKIRLNGGYYYTHSTNQVALTLPRIPEGQQLFYTPIHQTNGTFSVQYKGFLVAYNHRWTSETLGLNDNLGAFDLGQFRFNYQLKWQKFKTDLLFNINNCWNANYYVVEYRPMARRHFQIGLSLYI